MDPSIPPHSGIPTLHDIKSTKAGFQFQSNPPGLTFFYHSSITDPSSSPKSAREGSNDTNVIENSDNISPLLRILLSIAFITTTFIWGMNATIIGNAQVFIAEHFQQPAKLGWIGVSFALGSAVAVLPVHRAARVLDTKWLCVGCIVAYVAATALCGGASSMDAVLVGRAFAGATGVGMALTNAQLFARFTMRENHAWFGFTTTSILGAGCIIAPVVSGALCESRWTWRWVFYIQTIALGAMIPVYLVLVPSKPKSKETTYLTTMSNIDLRGTLFLSGGLVSFALAFTSGGSLYAWNSGRTIASIVLFVVCTTMFVITQWFSEPSKRLFPGSLLRNTQLALLFITTASASAALLISIYYIPVHFLFVYGDNANVVALRVIPFVSFWWWVLIVCGALLPRTGYHGIWYVFSGLCLTAGGATMYTVRADTTPQAIAGYMTLYILGLITSEAHALVGSEVIALSGDQQGGEEPAAASQYLLEKEGMDEFYGFAQALGGMVGLGIASAVFQNGAYADLSRTLNGRGLDQEQLRSAITGVRSALWQSLDDEALRLEWLDILVRKVDKAWMLVVVAGGVYTICAYGMSRKRFMVRRGSP